MTYIVPKICKMDCFLDGLKNHIFLTGAHQDLLKKFSDLGFGEDEGVSVVLEVGSVDCSVVFEDWVEPFENLILTRVHVFENEEQMVLLFWILLDVQYDEGMLRIEVKKVFFIFIMMTIRA